MSATISPLACVDPQAEIGDEVYIGPYCVVESGARIGRGSRLENSVTLSGRVTLGEDNHIFAGSCIGGPPQDLGYRGQESEVQIGDRNVIRECVTINRGSHKEDGVTRLGSDNFLMAGCHVAHDCRLGSHIVIANNTLLAGHVHVQDHASISATVGIHHFATVGSWSFIGGMSRVSQDVPPYMLVEGYPARPRCVNVVALKRNGFSPDAIAALSEAHRLLYRARVGRDQAAEILLNAGQLTVDVQRLLDFAAMTHGGRHGRGRDIRRAA
jgi:UDP-N-acetylglucosamine acyltransferase